MADLPTQPGTCSACGQAAERIWGAEWRHLSDFCIPSPNWPHPAEFNPSGPVQWVKEARRA